MSIYHFHFNFIYSYPCCYSVIIIDYTRCIILYRLAVLFVFETEDGCRSSETCISNLKPCVVIGRLLETTLISIIYKLISQFRSYYYNLHASYSMVLHIIRADILRVAPSGLTQIRAMSKMSACIIWKTIE